MIYSRQIIEEREEKTLAPYAVKSARSEGRVYPEEDDALRTCFQRDRDRIIHSKAFRRLMEKTQVFVVGEGDHYRNRMSHSIECAQVSRGLARGLGLNEDLTEAIALAHDLGHTPFGHSGEAAMHAAMQRYGLRFEHNEQSRRIVELLESPYPEFDGLNLTKEVVDGLLKHRTPFDQPLMKFTHSAHLEAQVVDLGDEIAYMCHDLDDGLRAEMFSFEEVAAVPIVARAVERGAGAGGAIEAVRKIRGARIASALMKILVRDVVETTTRLIDAHHVVSLDDVRAFDGVLVQFSSDARAGLDQLRAFLFDHYYFSEKVLSQSNHGKDVITCVFDVYRDHPEQLPERFQRMLKNGGGSGRGEHGERLEIVVKDYVAGMTDHFAEQEYRNAQALKKAPRKA